MSITTEAPQDSVLRRHWQASREIQANNTQSQSNLSSNTTSSSGFFSWLKSLFG
ncbi:MAG: hypothetical protein AB8B89_09295 [Gammaproteobacteria bacterium]